MKDPLIVSDCHTASDEFVRLAASSGIRCRYGIRPDIRIGFSGNVRADTDDYEIRSVRENGRTVLRLAGGNTRAVFYAVYRYFERFCGCRWFQDGDSIPKLDALPLENIRYAKRFRLQYRGMRYFAHRSLHRFQAEQWTFDDWKREIDFLLKKQFSMFMLRIGNDDLFQKAFPDFVPYPPHDGPAPEAVERSYNDRTTFHPLEERGILRKKILDYAFARGLMHPEDIGPTTHWYTPTPKAFLEHEHPGFMRQSSKNYALDTLQIWNCDDDKNIERYLKLTETHLGIYGRPELFHIIGLAERAFGTRTENFRTKVRVFRKFEKRLHEKYPDSPLLVAGWDFMFRWNAREVRRFLAGLDPSNHVILDYTCDSDFRKNDFRAWGLPGHFPWIFGIFQGLEPQNALFFDFGRVERSQKEIRRDPFCRGMVLWSETSHSNPLLTEFLARKSADEPFSLRKFCTDRYGKDAFPMFRLWKCSAPLFAAGAWTFDTDRPLHGLFENHFNLLSTFAGLEKSNSPEKLLRECGRLLNVLKIPPHFFAQAAAVAGNSNQERVRRDLIDLARTVQMCVISRELCMFYRAVCGLRAGSPQAEKYAPECLVRKIRGMERILACSTEFSLNDSFQRLKREGPVNSHSELTIKGNAENAYCRSYVSELYRAIYIPEAEFLSRWLKTMQNSGRQKIEIDSSMFHAEEKRIRDSFYQRSLSEFAPEPARLPLILQKLASGLSAE